MRQLIIRFFGASSFALAIACGHTASSPTAPIPPAPPIVPIPAPPPASVPNWRGDATVISVVQGAGGPCGWGTTAGETRKNVLWRITTSDASISLDEDMSNWPTDDVPYSGTVSGQHFTASYSMGSEYLKYVCQFKGGELSGDFNADFSSMDGVETLTWGPPGSESIVQRHWVGMKY